MNDTTKTPATKAPKVEQDIKMTDGRIVTFAGKRRMLKESTIADDGTVSVRFDFVNGETRTFVVPAAMIAKFAAHGAEQKIGDETAGEEDVDDMILAVDDVCSRLGKGEWSARAEGGGMKGMSVLLKALIEFTKKTPDEAKTFLAGRSQKEKLALREHPPIKAIITRIESEKANKGPAVDVGGLLAGFDAAQAGTEVPAPVVETQVESEPRRKRATIA